MIIIYRSNTGFTKAYAGMLGKAEKMKVLSVSEAGELVSGQDIFYMGPLMAGHVMGLDQAVKRYTVKGICGVGMSPPGPQVLSGMEKANFTSKAPLFYLQGGWAPKKVSWLKRRMVGMATRSVREALKNKGSRRTSEENKYLDYLIHGGNCVAFENLSEIRKWIKENKT